jgi:hypothetical protein
MSLYIESLADEMENAEGTSTELLMVRQQQLIEEYPFLNRKDLKTSMLYEYCLLLDAEEVVSSDFDSIETLETRLESRPEESHVDCTMLRRGGAHRC